MCSHVCSVIEDVVIYSQLCNVQIITWSEWQIIAGSE